MLIIDKVILTVLLGFLALHPETTAQAFDSMAQFAGTDHALEGFMEGMALAQH